MPEAAAAPLAESLLVDAVAPAAVDVGLGTTVAGGLGGAGTVGSIFGAGAGAGAGATGLGGITSLSALPATVAEVSPVAMGQITSALAPTAAGTAGLGSLAGSAPASLATGLGGATTITPEITALQQQLAASQIPQVTELGQVAGKLTPEMLGRELTQNELIQNAIEDNVARTGSGAFSDSAINKAMTPDISFSGYDYGNIARALDPTVANQVGVYAPGTSDLVGGGVNAATGAPIVPGEGGGIGNLLSSAGQWMKENPLKTAAGAIGAYKLLNADNSSVPEKEKYSGPLSKFHYDPSRYTPYTQQPPANPYRAQYTSYAKGGIADLGGYSDGGQMLKGPGDGMSDSIPASIANKQPARLANEEFVVPADVVSHLGNGSSDAGAKQLYRMMDRVRKARTGTAKQGRQINPSKYMPV
jgi:hypothetical protein